VAFVFACASGDVVGHSDVEVMRAAGHDVSRITVFSHRSMMIGTVLVSCAVRHTAGGPQILRLRRPKPGRLRSG
jgi:hypothetical protein